MAPIKIAGSQIDQDTITALQLETALKNPIQSVPNGDFKKVTSIQYNPSTGKLLISYEE